MSECKTAWKYLKGSEKDFEGAPEWATMLVSGGEFVGKWFLESLVAGNQQHIRNDGKIVFLELDNNSSEYEIIAQREPITSVTVNISAPCGEDDLSDCIGVPLIDFGSVDDVTALIAERGARYGKFKDSAEIMRDLKHVMHEVDGWNNLSPSQKEALDMIQHKIGRILNGDPSYDDNWKDIAGYSKLIADELNGEIK